MKLETVIIQSLCVPRFSYFRAVLFVKIFDQLEELGLGVLAEEAGEKKRLEIARGVARGCAVGAQMTLFMGGVALLFRHVFLSVFLT